MELKKDRIVSKLLKDVYIPRMFKVRQIFHRPIIQIEEITCYYYKKEI